MISSVCWLPRGAAKAVPTPMPLTEEELAAMRDEAADLAAGVLQGSDGEDDEQASSGWETEDEDMDVETAVARARAAAEAIASSSGRAPAGSSKGKATKGSKAAASNLEAALAELDMDHYDSSDDSGAGDGDDEDSQPSAAVIARALGGRSGGIIMDDPYLQGPDSSDEEDEQGLGDMDSEERDDYVLRQSDLLILAARNEDDVSTIEVWVYEEPSSSTGGEANIYVHHDILLPAFPLCLAWMDFNPAAVAAAAGGSSSKANMVAVGSMDPGIEIWDLDLSDQVEPTCTLGGLQQQQQQQADEDDDAAAAAAAAGSGSSKKKAKQKAKAKAKKAAKKAAAAAPQLRPGSHSDAVLGLSWNCEFRNVLASGSADTAVKVWDLATQQCEHTLQHHSDKVQAVAWNPAEPPVLLTGSFDKTACLVDVRAPGGAPLTWRVSADVEALSWNPGAPTCFLVSSEDGLVVDFDARAGAGSSPLFRLGAHTKPTCAMSFCPAAPGLLATASTDKIAKLWDISDNKPKLLASQDPKLGAIFTAAFCSAEPYLLAMAGAKGSVGVWDVRSSPAVAAKYPELLRDVPASL